MNYMFAMLNTPEIFLILAVVLVLFGAKKLPELARGMGQGLKEFKKASRDMTDEIQASINEEPATPPARRIAAETQPRQETPIPAAPVRTEVPPTPKVV